MNFKTIRKTVNNRDFQPHVLAKKSAASAGLCQWVLNIIAYHDLQIQYNAHLIEKKKPKKVAKVPETVKMNL